MPTYVLKILIDMDAHDDLEARQIASSLMQSKISELKGVRDIVLNAQRDKKSIHMLPDGTFPGQWNKGAQ